MNKKIIFNVFKNKVNKNSLKDALVETIQKNDDCIDFLTNVLSKHEDSLKFNENDEEVKYSIAQLKYAIFVLKYNGDLFDKNLRSLS